MPNMKIFVLYVASIFLEQVEFLIYFETVILKVKFPNLAFVIYNLKVSQPLYPNVAMNYLKT